VEIALEKERRRFQRQENAFARFEKSVKHTRQKLADLKGKNRQLMDLKFKLQKEYWQKTKPLGLELEPTDGHERKRNRFANSVRLSY
jgi:hypothetical protein